MLNFDIPVFKTSESNPERTKVKLTENQNKSVSVNELTGIQILESNEILRLGFLDQSKKSVGKVFLIIGGLFSLLGLGALFALTREGGFALIATPIPFIFLLIGLGFGYAGIETNFGEVLLQVSSRDLLIERRIFGKKWSSLISVADIKSVEISEGMKRGDEAWYNIKIFTFRKLPHSIPCLLKARSEAQWLCEQIQAKIGKRAS